MAHIIVKGLVVRDITDPSLIILITDGKAEHWVLPEWASPYIGKRMLISLEEEKPIVNKKLAPWLRRPLWA